MQSQEKYAVLITGDYAAKLSDIPTEALWNGGEDLKVQVMEFWNDTYLMWELLKSKGYSDENIFILFADGNDYVSNVDRYTPPTGVTLTDYAANRSNVVGLFENLYNGTGGLPKITDDDFLFVWTFGHGDGSNGTYSLCLIDGFLQDTILSPLINRMPANRKAVWMQQCYGGGFANTLQADNSVFHSACQNNQIAFRADDCTNTYQSYIENEFYDDIRCTHGEFNYHVISVNNGYSPTFQNNYNGIMYSSADLNNDGIISFQETYIWENGRESIISEEPLYSDLGNIGGFSSLEYPTLLYDTISSNTEVRGIVAITKDLIIESGSTLSFYANSDITILDSVKVIVEKGAALSINGDINISGNSNSVIIEGKFLKTDGSNLTLNNIDISTNSTVTFDDIVFNNSTISAVSPSLNKKDNCLITISNCEFNNPERTFCINVDGYNSYEINNNNISSCNGIGVKIYYSGTNLTDSSFNITSNTISNCNSEGLLLYSSVANISMNNIHDNSVGMKLLNNCTILQLSGNMNNTVIETQRITDNDTYEVYMTTSCVPSNFHYNYIYDNDRYPFVYYDSQLGTSSGQQIYANSIDVSYNNWGNIADPSNYLYSYTSNTTYKWDPIWNEGRSVRIMALDSLTELANNYLEEKNFVKLQSVCKSIVENYPETTQSENALKLLFNIEEYVDDNYVSLKSYYLSNPIIQSKIILAHLANYLANKCDEELGNWQESIAWYQNTMNNPNSSYNDSLFASIDLEYLYLKLGIRGNSDWQKSTDILLSSLPCKKQHVSLETSWTDVVTSQPEGYVVNEDGNVSITSGEGLAWLISIVNGLNGQESNDCKDITVTLENDVNIADHIWTAIGSDENPFRGIFNGQGFYIRGIKMNDAMEGRNFGLFGYLDNAVVKDVKLGKGQMFGYENCGGIAYIADNNTIIDKCVVKTEMAFCNYSGGIVGINKDSKISNCALISERFEGAMTCVGGIAGQNISTNADAIIENCYVSTVYISSYSTEYAGGIVGKNITEDENHKAIIRNCYAAPLNMYSHSGGVAAYNSENSLIENSYYTIVYGSNDYILCEENEGEITSSTLFNEELLLEENVEVYGEVVGLLLEALNKWVENSQGQYSSWCVMEDENYGYPTLEFMVKDYTNMEEFPINSMLIYPNPAHDYIKIESERKSEIKVYSVKGQIVLKQNINEGVSTIDISNLNSGVYFIDVDGNINKLIVR